MTGPRHSFQSYRTTGLPVFSSQQNLRSCLAHKIPTVEPSFQGKTHFLTERTRPSVRISQKLARSSTIFSAISDYRTSCIQLTAKFEIMFSTQNTHCGAPFFKDSLIFLLNRLLDQSSTISSVISDYRTSCI